MKPHSFGPLLVFSHGSFSIFLRQNDIFADNKLIVQPEGGGCGGGGGFASSLFVIIRYYSLLFVFSVYRYT